MISPEDPNELKVRLGLLDQDIAVRAGIDHSAVRDMLDGNIRTLRAAWKFAEALETDPLNILRWWELQQAGDPTPPSNYEILTRLRRARKLYPSKSNAEKSYLSGKRVVIERILGLARKHNLSFTGLCAEHMLIVERKKKEKSNASIKSYEHLSCEELEESILKAFEDKDIKRVDELWHETRRRRWPRRRMIRVFESKISSGST